MTDLGGGIEEAGKLGSGDVVAAVSMTDSARFNLF